MTSEDIWRAVSVCVCVCCTSSVSEVSSWLSFSSFSFSSDWPLWSVSLSSARSLTSYTHTHTLWASMKVIMTADTGLSLNTHTPAADCGRAAVSSSRARGPSDCCEPPAALPVCLTRERSAAPETVEPWGETRSHSTYTASCWEREREKHTLKLHWAVMLFSILNSDLCQLQPFKLDIKWKFTLFSNCILLILFG